jgi:hypothetical protein
MTREQKYLNDFLHDMRVLIKSDHELMIHATGSYRRGLLTIDEVLRMAADKVRERRKAGYYFDGTPMEEFMKGER